MSIFPYLWLSGAAIAALCILAEAGELLLLHWLALGLYLLSFLRWRWRGARELAQDEEEPDLIALRDLQAEVEHSVVKRNDRETDLRFGGRGPDELEAHLLLHCARLEVSLRQLRMPR